VDDLRQYIPVTPAQAEFLLRALKRLGARYEQRQKRKIYDMLIVDSRLRWACNEWYA